MSRKEQRPGGVKLTAKTARTLAMQEFGTARGLTKSTSFVGAYFMEFGNLRILWVAFLLGAVLTGTVIVFGYREATRKNSFPA